MLKQCYVIVRFSPASILTMCERQKQFLKRKYSDMSAMMPLSYAAAASKGIPPKSFPPGAGNSGQTNYSHQGAPGRDERRNEQHFKSDQRQSSNRGKSWNQGANNQQNYQSYDKPGKNGNNQNSYRGGGNYRRGKGRGVRDNFNNRNPERNSGYVNEETKFSSSHKQNQASYHQKSATFTPPRSRQNSESKDKSFWNKEPTSMSHSQSDTSDWFQYSESPAEAKKPTMSHSQSETSNWSVSSESPAKVQSRSSSEEVYNKPSKLTTESPPSSDQTRKDVLVSPVKSLTLSAKHSGCESKSREVKEFDTPSLSKRPPGLSDADFEASRKKKTSSRSEDTIQRNYGPDVNDTKKFESQESGKDKSVWKGVPISQLKRAPECLNEFATSQATGNESADLHSEIQESREPKAKKVVPSYVFLPHHQKPGLSGANPRWQNIEQILETEIHNYWNLVEVLNAIAYHNPPHSQHGRYQNPQHKPNDKLDLRALHAYFETLTNEECQNFFRVTLPSIQKLALQLPSLFPEPLPILKQRLNKEITLTQEQTACLLANAFFNTFPQRPHNQEGKPLQMPDFNFINLYGQMKSERKVEKLKCLMNYFARVTQNMPDGNVTYRRVYRDTECWLTMEKTLTNLHVSCEGTIEDARGFLQADFANKYVGGGVLNTGLVQEEIRFVLCPEMIVSRLLTEMLTNDEVLVMIGCERFNDYSGYSDTFKFTGDHFDNTERDNMKRKYTEVVAMDASVFRDGFYEQFKMYHVQRELNKAHCAFKGNSDTNLPAVCTGNWGCGAFGGDKQLKALIQLMAASVANRDICYLTFGDTELCLQIGHIYDLLKTRNITIKDIMKILTEYSQSTTSDSVFTFIEQKLKENVNRPEKSASSDVPKKNFQSNSHNKKK